MRFACGIFCRLLQSQRWGNPRDGTASGKYTVSVRYCASLLTGLISNSPVRPGAEPGLFFENCPSTMLSKALTAGLSRLGFKPMSIDVQC